MGEAVEFMHGRGVMHRDLKPENVVLVSPDSDVDIKVCDFGIAKMGEISASGARLPPRSSSFTGSEYFLAPEMIYQEEYGSEVDIWAVGVMSYALLSGKLPFMGKNGDIRETYLQITEGKLAFDGDVWEEKSSTAIEFVQHMLALDAAKRPTAYSALLHPWLVQVCLEDENTSDGEHDPMNKQWDTSDGEDESDGDQINCYAYPTTLERVIGSRGG